MPSTHTCRDVACLGFPPYDGAMMGLIDVPANNCYQIPHGLEGKTAALMELLAIICHGHKIAPTTYGPEKLDDDLWIAIVGFGRMGAADLLYLKKTLSNPIIVVARSEEQRRLALQFGADAVAANTIQVGEAAGLTDELIGRVDETTGDRRTHERSGALRPFCLAAFSFFYFFGPVLHLITPHLA